MTIKKAATFLAMTMLPLHAAADDLYSGHPDAYQYSITMPFQMVNGGIFVDLMIKKQNYRFLLDTGAPTLVSPKFVVAQELKYSNRKMGFEDANGGKGQISTYHLPDIKLDRVTFSGYMASIFKGLDEPPLSCYNVSGIIGYNMLKESVLSLDFVNHKMTVSDSSPKDLEGKGYYPAGFYFNGHDGPILSLWHEFGNLDVILDTGSNGGISLNNPILNMALGELGYKGKQIKGGVTHFSMSAAKNDRESKLYDLQNFSLGKLEINKYPVTVKNESVRSLLGIKFLKQYDIVIDFKSAIAWFKPNGIETTSSVPPAFGIYPTTKEDKIIVDAVLEGSKADSLGISPGESIIKVNGKDTTRLTLPEECALFIDDTHTSYTIKSKTDTLTLSS